MSNFDSNQIANLRVEYSLKSFDISDIQENPLTQFELWLKEAIDAKANEPNAMTLATVGDDGQPSARIVLLKGIQDGGFTFYTNYESKKGQQLDKNNKVALVFCWLELQRQVRIEGTVRKLSVAESDAYFASRPRTSQIGAHASKQSYNVENRLALEKEYALFEKHFHEKTVTRPVNWGGYLVIPNLVEFWQGRQSRLHDRILFEKGEHGWKISRLQP
jgi:pyridoxamine 5'-phosphate oxidase